MLVAAWLAAAMSAVDSNIFNTFMAAITVAGGFMFTGCPSISPYHSCECNISGTATGNFFNLATITTFDSVLSRLDFDFQRLKVNVSVTSPLLYTYSMSLIFWECLELSSVSSGQVKKTWLLM